LDRARSGAIRPDRASRPSSVLRRSPQAGARGLPRSTGAGVGAIRSLSIRETRFMPTLSRLLALAPLAVLAGCYVAPYPYPTTVTPPPTVTRAAPSFDKSWDAALGAAADAGIDITSADKGAGRITGRKAGAAVAITLTRQSDNSLQVAFDAPDSKESNPSLSDRWLAAYQRRMGR
jgi:hypothetical protein